MRASGQLILRIFVKSDQIEEVGTLSAVVRDRAEDLGLHNVTLRQDSTGPVIEIAGNEDGLRRFWASTCDLGDLGLMVLQAA